jgi:hypothetical protein
MKMLGALLEGGKNAYGCPTFLEVRIVVVEE